MNTLTDFNKQCIHNCYAVMRDCISFDHIDDTEFICSSLSKIKQYEIALPPVLCEQINNFIDQTLHPILDDPDFFSATRSPEIGYVNEKGIFTINTDEALCKFFSIYFQISNDLENKIDAFANQYMKPYLV